MWEAVERSAGVYDAAYLVAINDLITKLGEAGISTLVDAHQDVLARMMCGEGFPDFYMKQVVGDNPVCIQKYIDYFMKPYYEKLNVCISMNDLGYRKDENGDFLIEDCQKKNFAAYYLSP